MSILEPVPQEHEEEFTSLGEEGSSLFDDIRSVNQKMRRTTTQDFDLPGYEQEQLDGKSALVARYNRVSLEKYTLYMREVNEAADAKRFDRVVELYSDFLIDNCEAILKRVPDGEPVDLGVKYDLTLADGLRFEAHSCQDVVRGVFGGNELAIAEHAETVFEWMRSGKSRDDEEALGKS